MTDPAAAGTTPRQSVAIIGAGAIGSAFAYHLARAGHRVSVVARPGSSRLGQLLRDQAIVTTAGVSAAVTVADRLDEQTFYDLIIVTTLAHQIDAVVPSLQRSNAGCIHFMFNNFNPGRLSNAVGESRCTFGMPFVMSRLDQDGKLDATVSSSRKTLHSDQRWVDLFSGAGIPSAYEADMQLWLRCHVPVCIALESLAFTALQRGTGVSWAEAILVARGLRSGLSITKTLASRLYPLSKKLLNQMPAPALAALLWLLARNRPFRELLATGVHECRALIHELTAAATDNSSILPATVRAVVEMTPKG